MAERSILPANWEVPPVFRERLGESAGRQRAMVADGHLLLVLHRPPKPDEDERHGRFFWRRPDGSWSSSEAGRGSLALKKHLAEYAEVVDHFDEKEQAAQSAEDYFEIIQAVTPVHRAARNMLATLQDARKAIPQDRDLINYRDQAYDIDRTAELLCTDARHGMEFAIARRTEEQAHSSHRMSVASHRLNMLVAFFFPIATLSAIFGMNMAHPFESAPAPLAFWLVMGIGLVSGFCLKAFVSRA